MPGPLTAHRGQIIHCLDNTEQGLQFFADGLLLLQDGRVLDVGPATELGARLTGDIEVVDHSDHLICPGFIDCHVHFPQLDVIASYGAQSEKIKPYTELGLVADIETPPITKLRGWLDPYSYIKSYTQEKLILLGTNDAYWTVDALQHYWPDLPEPKAVYQNPNTEHSLRRARKNWETLASWVQLLADKEPVPRLRWQYIKKPSGKFSASLSSSASINSAKLWETTSESRDFRQSRWRSREVQLSKDRKGTTNILVPEAARFKAFFYEVEYSTGRGNKLLLSSQTQVIEPGTQQR